MRLSPCDSGASGPPFLERCNAGLESVDQREHLLALASRTMRRVLIDEARRASAPAASARCSGDGASRRPDRAT
jgi:hypothetical protein